jgi:ribosome-associated translation inhibitor RaiA
MIQPTIQYGLDMQTPLQITFRHMDSSPAVETRIRELAAHLKHFHERITGCHVVIEKPAAHRNKGAPFTVRLDILVPGRELYVNSKRDEHVDVYVALRDAFDSARRMLEDHMRTQRGDIKRH